MPQNLIIASGIALVLPENKQCITWANVDPEICLHNNVTKPRRDQEKRSCSTMVLERKHFCVQEMIWNIPKMLLTVSCIISGLFWKFPENTFICFL